MGTDQDSENDGSSPEPTSDAGTSRESLRCTTCKVDFRTQLRYARHEYTKHLPSRCDICNRKFKGGHALQHHKKIIHSDEWRNDNIKDRQCPYCGKQFSKLAFFEKHLSKFCKLKPIDSDNE